MAAVQRIRRRVLTYLIALLGGAGFVLGITEKDARAKEAVSPQGRPSGQVDSRAAYVVQPSNRYNVLPEKPRELELPADLAARQEIVIQQQDILVKMEELRLMMEALQEKLGPQK